MLDYLYFPHAFTAPLSVNSQPVPDFFIEGLQCVYYIRSSKYRCSSVIERIFNVTEVQTLLRVQICIALKGMDTNVTGCSERC